MLTHLTTRDWHVKPWRGSLAELADAAQVAVEEMHPHTGSAGIFIRVNITLTDARRELISLDELREAATELPLAKVEEVSILVGSASPTPTANTVHIRAGTGIGVRVYAEHTSASFTHGVVSLIAERLKDGETAARRNFKRGRLRKWDRVWVGVGLVCCLAFLSLPITAGVDDWYGIVTSILFASIPALFVSWPIITWMQRQPPPLTLVRPGDEDDPSLANARPVMRARDWFVRHPAIALLGSFGLAVASSIVATLLVGGSD